MKRSIHTIHRLILPSLALAAAAWYTFGAAVPEAAVKAGDKVLPFEVKNTDGKTVKFPDDYKGKVVLLDFWATWCGPCMSEMPNVVASYDKYHSRGFEILGISLDREKSEAKLASVTKAEKMPWQQVYDGKFWDAAIAVKYNIKSIPHAFLVDGTSGKVVADGDSIRGNKLAPAIEKALAATTASAH
jgi:thiol-disulfide isomerase/thioredoxin